MSNAYCSLDQLYAVMDKRVALDLSSDDNDHTGRETVLQTLLDFAASEVDTFLQGRYAPLPLVNPPAVVTLLTATKARFKIHGRRGIVPDQIASDNRWADELLDKLMKGFVSLPGLTRVYPVLQDSNSLNGRSSFDWMFGVAPSATSPGGQALGLTVPSKGAVQSLT